MIVDAIATVILAVHVHGNATLIVIATLHDDQGGDHDHGSVPVQVHGHDHGSDHVDVRGDANASAAATP